MAARPSCRGPPVRIAVCDEAEIKLDVAMRAQSRAKRLRTANHTQARPVASGGEPDQDLGLDSVKETLLDTRGQPAGVIADRVFRRARAFGPQLDDETILLVTRTDHA
jgi:hypothetical protein